MIEEKEITEEDLRKAIRDALTSKPPKGFLPGETSAPTEAKRHGISIRKCRKILKQLAKSGVLEPTRVMYVDDWGDKLLVKGYRLIETEGE